ncbi:DUF456 domain-containing protein [Natrinema thermotolerans]|uniref:DUF456 domain-containing protein n=1 Tax=Natrinema thermotolerans TaxID=121872 RepID=A0AAF0PEK0_9EURY|nr:hypothetical protein [Natrinema thermotolerans]QCC60845.1 DUF456 domain-containing protein [Natrinema thermotolerans]WMT09236.1 DUF456 domain-containing protein [Natrinema thermotolerans]
MSDRSDEVTESRDPAATDDLLEETDRLLSDSGTDVGDAGTAADAAGSEPAAPIDDPLGDSSLGPSTGTDRDAEQAADDGDDSRSWLAPITSRLSLGRYFSPKEYLALVALLGVGLVGGSTVLPVAGRLIGMFGVAFLVGLVASKRRYLEVGIAGVSVGGIAAVLNNAVLAAVGSGQSLVAVGATVGLLAAVVGYYFGRDLRDGLARDI